MHFPKHPHLRPTASTPRPADHKTTGTRKFALAERLKRDGVVPLCVGMLALIVLYGAWLATAR
jgi:hypothetical protein